MPTFRTDDPVREVAWMDQAACAGIVNDLIWFPDLANYPQLLAVARGICDTCPVHDECLAYALRHPETRGVWAGTIEQQRIKLRKLGKRESVRGGGG